MAQALRYESTKSIWKELDIYVNASKWQSQWYLNTGIACEGFTG